MTLTTAEIEAGLELAKKCSRGSNGMISILEQQDNREAFKSVAANHYESLAAEVIALRKAVAAMNDARCRHNLEDLLKALDTALSGATP